MFRHACAFVDCAKYCEIEPNNIEYRTQSNSVAGIVNAAFACEVFIKTLLVFQGVPLEEIKGHELKKLWNKFKEKDLETALSVEQIMREAFNSKDENVFNKLLFNISNAFEYYRYIYEKERSEINPQYLRFFRIALRNVCCRQLYNKSWNEYINDNQE